MKTFANKVTVVGVGDDGSASLTEAGRSRIAEAQVIIGSDRLLLTVEPPSAAETLPLSTDLGALQRWIEKDGGARRTVILAPGDPLFYGVARFLIDRLGKENFEVLPHVSSMQLAFARVMESWDDAYLTNVANHPPEEIIDRIRTAEKVGLFTTTSYPPSAIARDLLQEGIDYFRVYVCENLGSRNEVITQASLSEIAEMEFGPLNVMILARLPDVPDRPRSHAIKNLFGNPDDAFRQSRPKRGLITPMEVRALAIAQLGLRTNSVVWDIGAGSGAVAIEAARLANQGMVHAIEPDMEDCQLIRDNAALFEVTNVEVICGRAPEAFDRLPAPDSVFLGGLGREMQGIAEVAYDLLKPGGRFVASVATLEKASSLVSALRKRAGHVGISMINIGRGVHQLESTRFEAMQPVFLLYGVKTR